MDSAELVRAALDRLNEHDLVGYYALMTDDVVNTHGLGTFRGKEAVAATADAAFATMSDHWRRIDRLLVSGDEVAVWLTFGAVVAKTGRPFELEACTIYTIRDGAIAAITEYADWSAAFAAAEPTS